MGRSVTFLIAFTFLAGGILGYLIRAGSEEPPPAVLPSAGGSSTAPVPPDAVDFAAAANPGGRPSISDALADIPLPEHPAGRGTITGQVRLKEGGPLAGVLVRAERLRTRSVVRTGEGPPEDQSIEALVREFVHAEHLVRTSRSECRTDAEGRYLLPGLANEKYQVMAYLEGYEIRTNRRGSRHILLPGNTGDFVARPVVKLPVRVLLPDGELAPTARILSEGRPLTGSPSWTPASPELALAPGTWTLRAIAGPEDRYTSRVVRLELVAGLRADAVEFVVEDLPGVMGKVIAASGGGERYLQVRLLHLPEGTSPSPDLLGRGGKTSSVQTGGTYAFRDISPGTYLVGLLDRRRGVKDHAVVQVGDGVVFQDLSEAGSEPERVLTVRVEAPDGTPVVRAAVRAKYRAWTSGWSGATGAAQGDGTYLLPHREVEARARRPGGKYYAEAFTRTYGTARVEYDPESLAPVCIRYQEPAVLDLTLTGYTDTPYDGNTSLSLTTAEGAEEGTAHTITDYGYGGGLSKEGRRQYPALQPGGYDLAIWVSTAAGGRYRVAQERLVLARGANNQTISLPPLGTLIVLVKGPHADLRYRLEARGGVRGYSATQGGEPQEGRVVFRGLPPGSYVLSTSGGGRTERMYLAVTGDRTVEFHRQDATALRVTIHRQIGYLQKSGLRNGDLVIGIDGEEFTTEARMEAAMALAREKQNVTLMVRRGGTSLTLPVDLTRAESHIESGGQLQPTTRE